MTRASATFNSELAEILGQLETDETRLRSLRDLAEYEELPETVLRRIQTKATVVGHARDALAEIPGMCQ